MGVYEALLGTGADTVFRETIDSVSVGSMPIRVQAPVSGLLVSMEDIPDPVFASGLMGATAGIWPEEGLVRAPVDGVITMLGEHMPYVVTMRSDDGVDVMLHVGIDTVELRGDGFSVLRKKGDRVEAGMPLIQFDKFRVLSAGCRDIVVAIVTNGHGFSSAALAGPDFVHVGDPIIGLKR